MEDMMITIKQTEYRYLIIRNEQLEMLIDAILCEPSLSWRGDRLSLDTDAAHHTIRQIAGYKYEEVYEALKAKEVEANGDV